jgi:tetratricopeptide (TPR) repeat protein
VPAGVASDSGEPATEPPPADARAFEPVNLQPLVFEPLDVSPVAPLEVSPTIETASLEYFDIADDVRASGDVRVSGDAGAEGGAGQGPTALADEEAASGADADAAFFVPDAVSLDDAPAGGPTLAADSVEALVAWIQPGSTDSLDFTGPLLGALPDPAEEDASSGFGSTSFSAGEPFEPQDIEAEFAADRFPSVPPAAERTTPAAGHSAVTDAFITPVEEPVEAPPIEVRAEAPVADQSLAAALPVAAPPVAEPPVAGAPVAGAPAALEPPRLESTAASQPTMADAQAYAAVGDRASAIRVLHELLQVHEQHARFTDVADVLDELARLDVDSLAVHHKRVELACRLDDRTRLVNAYLGLAGALRRGGNAKRARAVYQRVLDLEPELADAREAMDGQAAAPAESRGAQLVPETGVESALDHDAEPGARAADTVVAAPAALTPAHPPVPPPASPRRPMMHSNSAASADGTDTALGAPRRTEPVRSVPAPPLADGGAFVDLGDLLRDDDEPRSTRMVIEERAPTGDEQADFQEMLRKFKQGVSESVDEEDHESHYDLGVAYKEMGLVDEAIAAFQKALRGTDRRARTYEALGQCFVETRKFSVAAAVLRNALQEPGLDDRQLIGVLYLLGQAAEAVENQEEATVYYQRVFAVDVEFRDVSTRLDSLAQGAHPVSS